MRFLKSLLFAAALLFIPVVAQAQTYWTPQWNYVYRDGGNDLTPQFEVVVGNHGIASVANNFPIGVTTFGATWGTVVNSDTQGTDSDFSINFTTGTGAASVAGATIFTINFGKAWSNSTQTVADGGAVPMFGGQCYYLGPAAGTPGVSGFNIVPASASTATVISTTGFTPGTATTYHFGCHVFNLGAAF